MAKKKKKNWDYPPPDLAGAMFEDNRSYGHRLTRKQKRCFKFIAEHGVSAYKNKKGKK